MSKNADVVIVGGGIVGCATAYYLGKKGVKATIIERQAVAGCASGYAAGLLNPLDGHGIAGPLEELARESLQLHLRLADEIKGETGIDPQSLSRSSIWVAFTEAEVQGLMGLFQTAQGMTGFPTRWLEGQELRSLEPRISSRVIRGMCVEGTRQVDSYRITLGLALAAQKYGATLRHDTARGLRRSNGRVSGVELTQGEVDCEKVVLAMGPWTGHVADWLGIPVPVAPLKGQILRLDLEGPPLEHTFHHSGGDYITSKSDGLIWVGTTEERVGFDDQPTPEARGSIMKGATAVVPALSQASRLVLQTACLRPVSDDGLPIIGEVPGWDGVYVATGAGRNGILLGPAMGQAIADLVTMGESRCSKLFPISWLK